MIGLTPRTIAASLLVAGATTIGFCLRDCTGRAADGDEPKPAAKTAVAANAVPLNKNGTVLIDKKGKRILLKGQVALREGTLEMLCCLKQTKEHESVLSVDAKAYTVHTALLALGAKVGSPVQFTPKYVPPSGQRIRIFVNWSDDQGKAHRELAQSWVRETTRRFWVEPMDQQPPGLKIPANSELRYDKKLKELSWYGHMTADQKNEFLELSEDKAYRAAIEKFFDRSQFREMKANWVFAGSGLHKDEDTGKNFYLAEDGNLICVANFQSATIDVAMESTSEGTEGLLFEANTERIPPKETPVTIELVLVDEPETKPDDK